MSFLPSLPRRRRHTFAVLVTLAALPSPGCVERLLNVRSEPSGATVFVDGEEVGTTPLDHPFDFYGTVGVVVRRPGYRSRRVLAPLEPPWYEWFPLDFISENLVPWRIEDRHEVRVTLEPVPGEIPPRAFDELRSEGDRLKQRALDLEEDVEERVGASPGPPGGEEARPPES